MGNLFGRCSGCAFVAGFSLVVASTSWAAGASELALCRAISDKQERLDCYDALALPAEVPRAAPSERVAAQTLSGPPGNGGNADAISRWSIDKVPTLRPHKPNYVVFRQTTAQNNNPFRDSIEFSPAAPGPVQLDHNELKFQLSIKGTILEPQKWLGGASLWLGYTQQSYWQLWNGSISRPFRETNYEPEAMLVWEPPEIKIYRDFALKHIVGGFVHQSNGRGDPLSRSWNRVYAQFEMSNRERTFEIIARPWFRIPEDTSDDNNRDIQRYVGYGDLVFNYRWNDKLAASLLVRNNLQARHNRSAFQLDLSPRCSTIGELVPKLQIFIGPGEGLIDYNHRQKSISLGFEISGWLDPTFARKFDRCSWL